MQPAISMATVIRSNKERFFIVINILKFYRKYSDLAFNSNSTPLRIAVGLFYGLEHAIRSGNLETVKLLLGNDDFVEIDAVFLGTFSLLPS